MIKPWQLIVCVTCVVHVITISTGEKAAVPVRVVDLVDVDVDVDVDVAGVVNVAVVCVM